MSPQAPIIDSLEVRWFVPGPLAPEAQAWFGGLGSSLPPEARTDRYLVPAESDDLGLKIREGTIQAKQRTGVLGLRPLAPGVVGYVETWRKWTLGTAEHTPEAGWLDVAKVRRQRALVTIARGAGHGRCALELSEIEADGHEWWSVCLEASGDTSRAQQAALRSVAGRWLSGAPGLSSEASMGYPAWLRRLAE